MWMHRELYQDKIASTGERNKSTLEVGIGVLFALSSRLFCSFKGESERLTVVVKAVHDTLPQL